LVDYFRQQIETQRSNSQESLKEKKLIIKQKYILFFTIASLGYNHIISIKKEVAGDHGMITPTSNLVGTDEKVTREIIFFSESKSHLS